MNHQVGKWTLYDFGDHAMLFEGLNAPVRVSISAAESLIELSQIECRYIDKVNPEPAPDADMIRVLVKWVRKVHGKEVNDVFVV